MSAVIDLFGSAEWEDLSVSDDVPTVMRDGVRRRRFLKGEGGFHCTWTDMDPGHVVRPHSHSHDELLVVFGGSITFGDGSTLNAKDSIFIPARMTYRFTVGVNGVEFLLVRRARASMSVKGDEE